MWIFVALPHHPNLLCTGWYRDKTDTNPAQITTPSNSYLFGLCLLPVLGALPLPPFGQDGEQQEPGSESGSAIS